MGSNELFHHCIYYPMATEFDRSGPVWESKPKTRCFFAPMNSMYSPKGKRAEAAVTCLCFRRHTSFCGGQRLVNNAHGHSGGCSAYKLIAKRRPRVSDASGAAPRSMAAGSGAGDNPMQEPGLVIDYAPRTQFVAFHDRTERFACIVTHRRAGKTVACIHDLQRSATQAKKIRPRFAYLSPFLRQSKTVAWDYLRTAMAPVRANGASAHETELRVDYPNGGQVRLYG